MYIDSAELVARTAATSEEFKDRYGHIGYDHVRQTEVVSGDELRSAAANAAMVLMRVGGDGGV